jgi:periodic tryptophan protein 2
MTSAGPLDLIDDDDSDEEDGTDRQSQKRLGFGLPGTGSNKARPVVRTKSLQLCPTGRSFAAATTEGLLLYSMDDNLVFDPADFDIDVTPEVISSFLNFHRLHNAATSLIF